MGLLEPAGDGEGGRHYRALYLEDLGDPLQVAAQQGYEIIAFTAGRDLPVAILEIAFRPGGKPPCLEQPYQLLELGGGKALRRRLESAATEGYRLIGGATPGGDRFYMLERREGTAEYRFPQAKDRLAAINEAAAEGFRLLPFTWGSTAVMEREGASPGALHYRLVGDTKRDDADVTAWIHEIADVVQSGGRIVLLTARYQVLVEEGPVSD